MQRFIKWLSKVLSSDNDASMKRVVCFLLVVCYAVSHFLMMYIKVEIANERLVMETLNGMQWMILIFGGLVTSEGLVAGYKARQERLGSADIKRAEQGIPAASPVTVTQAVENQNIDAKTMDISAAKTETSKATAPDHSKAAKTETSEPTTRKEFLPE